MVAVAVSMAPFFAAIIVATRQVVGVNSSGDVCPYISGSFGSSGGLLVRLQDCSSWLGCGDMMHAHVRVHVHMCVPL